MSPPPDTSVDAGDVAPVGAGGAAVILATAALFRRREPPATAV